jgi:hypothetical protein
MYGVGIVFAILAIIGIIVFLYELPQLWGRITAHY